MRSVDPEREAFTRRFDVSRETLARLDCYHTHLTKWNARINLVGAKTLDQIWRRHFMDSAQLLDCGPKGAKSWVDLGSGAGFPGLVIACLAVDRGIPIRIALVESDARKAAFLQNAACEMGLDVDIRIERIEATPPGRYDVVCARALAPLDLLLGYAARLCAPKATCLFLKGARWEMELTKARQNWHIALDKQPSLTDPQGAILIIKELWRAE